ncbi:hypothetical protein ACAH01_11120 [Halomicrobium sp. HM KBTZ05]|uniref:Uncharacterized protein n=1 Tax=Halomicrobium mukohataei TaxID=57705 RepID=A0A847UG97_9EURY|nr:hypothetical protein [Halomicrobium mukohataei]NLV10221.1 hypothetical protein [Halomicrobium mukohataei]
MERYDTRIDDDTLFVEVGDDDLEIGRLDDIYDLVGGETYTIEYSEKAQAAAWLTTDDDGTFTFDVRETLADMDYNETIVEKLASKPVDATNTDGYPVRTATFAQLMMEIWDSKGTVDLSE